MGEELTFSERLLHLIGEEKPFAWAARNDVAKSSIHNVLKFGRPPGPDQLIKISRATGRSIEWLLTGRDFSAQHKGIGIDDDDGERNPELVWIPYILTGGNTNQLEKFPLSKKVIDSIRANGKRLAFAYQRGDSMEPTISEDDLLLVDQDTSHFTADGIYLILSDEVQMAKRLQKKMGGKINVQNDNPMYKSQTIYSGSVGYEILGKIVMVMHKL